MRTHRVLVALLATSALSPALTQRRSTASLLERYALPSAICADGSAGFYFMAANASSNDYIFRFMGGAGCAYNETYCEEIHDLSARLFTSDGWPETTVGYGLLSGDAWENPLYSTYNRVFVPYCTQDMHLLDTESLNGELQFRGRPYLEETLTSVLSSSSQGSTVMLVGSSSGGVAAFNAVSWLLDSFDQVAELSVILDSAYIFDVDGTLTLGLDYLRKHPLAAYSPHCSEEFDGGPCCLQFGCSAQRGYFPLGNERLKGTLLVSPAQDAMPLFLDKPESPTAARDDEDEDEEVTLATLWDGASYVGQTRSLLRNIASLYPAEISVFAPSCMDHNIVVSASAELWMCFPSYEEPIAQDYYDDFSCTFEEDRSSGWDPSGVTYVRTVKGVGLRAETSLSAAAWENLQIDGISIRAAVEQWWKGRGDASKQVFLVDACNDLNCNPTCQSGFLPGTRDESDSMLVWLVVLATITVAMLVFAVGIYAVVRGLLQGKRVEMMVASALDERLPKDGIDKSASFRDLRPKASLQTIVRNGEGDEGGGQVIKPILEWRALSYWLPTPQRGLFRFSKSSGKRRFAAGVAHQENQLLYSMHGTVPEGALCALMGPSGSGKSTLLDLLTGRKDYGRCEGDVLFKGNSITDQQEDYIRQSGYMRQVNTGYLEGLTVLENLVYAAMLRFPGTTEEQCRRVQTAIEQALLERSVHTKAGKLSGGQKRRLKIALELLVDRQLLFLDEPTSGLDASASLELVTLLKRLSRKITLVVAIHQPRPEVWQLFSHAILLSGGRTVYCGPVDKALAGTASYLLHTTLNKGWKACPEVPIVLQEDESLCAPSHRSPPTLGEYPLRGESGPVMSAHGNPMFSGNPSGAVVGGTSAAEIFLARTGMSSPKNVDSSNPACPPTRATSIFRMRQWESNEGIDGGVNSVGIIGQDEESPIALAQDPTEQSEGKQPDPMPTGRSIPDKILDRLVMIGIEHAVKPQEEEALNKPCDDGRGHSERTSSARSASLRLKSPSASIILQERQDSNTPNTYSGRESGSAQNRRNSVLKVATVLLARSCKSGYARDLALSSAMLVVALAFIVISLRVASDEGMMLHLVISVLSVSMLPVLLVYAPIMLVSVHDSWPLIKLEVADGFYSPYCAAVRYVIDHFAAVVLLSFVVVSVAHAGFWGDIISGLPASGLGVNLQLSCAMTLTGWIMISLFDSLVISSLNLGLVFGISNALNTIWAVFSGTILLVKSIPLVLRAVTYSSPHYWATFFGLRVLLDGLDLTSSCEFDSKVYCATSYGDLVASSLDLHIHTTALSLLCLAAMAAVGLVSLAAMVYFKGRHVRIIGGLDKPVDSTPHGDRHEQTRIGGLPRGSLRLSRRSSLEQSRRSIAPRVNRGDVM